jgi:hypothetical protein
VAEEVERETAHQRLRLGSGVEFRLGDGDGLMARGALPKGTTRRRGAVLRPYMAADQPCAGPFVASSF